MEFSIAEIHCLKLFCLQLFFSLIYATEVREAGSYENLYANLADRLMC